MTERIFFVNGQKYVAIDYSSLLRFAVPYNKISDLGVDMSGKTDDDTLIAVLTDFLRQKGERDNKSFMSVMQAYAERVVYLKEKGLSVKEPIRFSFFVREDAEGIQGADDAFKTYSLDNIYKHPLQVGYNWFKNGYEAPVEDQPIWKHVVETHELAHVLHGAYFNLELSWLCEGIAEMVPFYLMDMEKEEPIHHLAILNLEQQDMPTLAFVKDFSCFGLGRNKNQLSQDLKTYQSMYLWMMGCIKRVEKKYTRDDEHPTGDKFKAFSLILEKFGEIAQLSDFNEKMNRLAEFVSTIDDNVSSEDLLRGRKLQLEGQKVISQMIKDHYRKNNLQLNEKKQDKKRECLILAQNIQKAKHLDEMGNVGRLFKNIVPRYLQVAQNQMPFNKNEQQLWDYIENFRIKYDLTAYDSVCAISERFLRIEKYPANEVNTERKITGVSELFDADKENISEIWFSSPENMFEVNGKTFVVIDYSPKIRFAVPFEEIKGFGVDTAQKTKEKILAELTNVIQEKGRTDNQSFAHFIQKSAQQVVALKEHGLKIKEPLRFSFFLLPNVKGLKCASQNWNTHPLDENYPNALQVSCDWVKTGYETKADKKRERHLTSLIHELSHVLHGGYFFSELGWVGEGFAEMVPYYLMGKENEDVKHQTAIINLKEKEMVTLDFLADFGCFAFGKPSPEESVQDLKTYQSLYLWMIGYIKHVEKIHAKDDKFKATSLLLEKFSEVAGISDFNEKMNKLAAFISTPESKISADELVKGKMLQLEGKKHVLQMLEKDAQTSCLLVDKTKKTPDEKEACCRLAEGIQKCEKLSGLGKVGVWFQNIVPRYLRISQEQKPFTKEENQFCFYMERLSTTYGLTKYDTVSVIYEAFKQISTCKDEAKQQKYVADVLKVKSEKIKNWWYISNFLSCNKKLNSQHSLFCNENPR